MNILNCKWFLILLVIVVYLNANAQKFKEHPAYSKTIKKNAAKIGDSLFMYKIEVTNKDYQYFLNYLKEKNRIEDLKIAQIDSAQWIGDFYNKPYLTHYHKHEHYEQYPVVNISYAGATLYCNWLTEEYNSNPKKKIQKVLFRLPTEQEWEYAAKGGNESAIFPWDGDSVKRKDGSYRANFKSGKLVNTALSDFEEWHILAPAWAYWPNAYEIYNMSGNVAEMVQEKGLSKGGDFLSLQDQIMIKSQKKYDARSTGKVTLGFRWVMVVLEE